MSATNTSHSCMYTMRFTFSYRRFHTFPYAIDQFNGFNQYSHYNYDPSKREHWLTQLSWLEKELDETHTLVAEYQTKGDAVVGLVPFTEVFVNSIPEYICFVGLFLRALIRFRARKRLKLAKEKMDILQATHLLCTDVNSVIKQYLY